MFFSTNSPQLIEVDCEKKYLGLINDVAFITHTQAVKRVFS
jgi:hypothetical protein